MLPNDNNARNGFNNNVRGGSGVGDYDEHVQWESREGGDAGSAEPGC